MTHVFPLCWTKLGVLLVISDGKEDSDLAASIGFLEELKNEWQSRNRGSQVI
jgi:hypothetical protein